MFARMDNAARIYRFFRNHGFSPAAAAGIVGNTTQESGNRPDAPGGGLIQGQGGRTSSGTLEQQLAGILGELQGPERGTARAIRGATDPRAAARIFSERFERPGTPMLGNRERYAVDALKRYGGINARATSAGGGPPGIETSSSESVDPEALRAALDEVAKMSGPQVIAAGAQPQRPSFAAGAAPPAPIAPKQPSAPQAQQLLEAALTRSVSSKLTPPQGGEAAAAGGGAAAGGAPASTGYPLAKHGKVIGLPYQGTHTLFGNWESDNAVDIAVPKGTPVYATEPGTIGSQIGPLSASDPKLAGQRLHLDGGNSWYYAHLSKIVVKPGQRVREGQLLGYSGEANGVQHLHIASRKGSPVGLTKR